MSKYFLLKYKKKIIVTFWKFFFLSKTVKIFYAVEERKKGREIQLFQKMDIFFVHFLILQKSLGKKKRFPAFTLCKAEFFHFCRNPIKTPTLCSISVFKYVENILRDFFIFINYCSLWYFPNNFIFFFQIIITWTTHWLYNNFIILIWKFWGCFNTVWVSFFKFWY